MNNKKKKKKDKYLYNKFLNTINYFRIRDKATRRKYFNKYFFISCITFEPVLLLTIYGYDFTATGNYIIYYFCFLFIYFSILQAFSLYQLDSTYKVFKSRLHLIFLLVSPFIITTICCIPPIWTTRCQWIDNHHVVDINARPLFFYFYHYF